MASALARRVPLTIQVYACFNRHARGRVALGAGIRASRRGG
jgi:hypothetical protein